MPHVLVLGGNGRLTRLIHPYIDAVKVHVKMRNDVNVDKLVERICNCDAVLLGQRMRQSKDVERLEQIMKKLVENKFAGHVLSLGSTTEYLPIPMREYYASSKRRALMSVTRPGRLYHVVHIICPSHQFVQGDVVGAQINMGMRRNEDWYGSVANSLCIEAPNTGNEFRRAMYTFSRRWFQYYIGVLLFLISYCVYSLVKKKYVRAGIFTAIGTSLTMYEYSGFKFYVPANRSDMWKPLDNDFLGHARMFEVDKVVRVRGRICGTYDVDGGRFRSDAPEIEQIMYSPSIMRVVQEITRVSTMVASIHSGNPPWALNHVAPVKQGKMHVDNRSCKGDVRCILNLHTCPDTDYKLDYIDGSGSRKSLVTQRGDLIVLGSAQHQPAAMTTGCRKIGFIDFSNVECRPLLYEIAVKRGADALKGLGFRV